MATEEWVGHGAYDRAPCLELTAGILSALDSLIKALHHGKGVGREHAAALAQETRTAAQELHDFMENPTS